MQRNDGGEGRKVPQWLEAINSVTPFDVGRCSLFKGMAAYWMGDQVSLVQCGEMLSQMQPTMPCLVFGYSSMETT